MTLDSDGKPITDSAKVNSGETIITQLAKGKLSSKIE